MQAKSIELTQGQYAASAADNEERDDAGSDAAEATTAFAPLMVQMLGTALQSGQQAAGEAGTDSAGLETGRVYETPASLAQVIVPSAEQAAASLLDDGSLALPEVQGREMTAKENTTTQFAGLLKEVKADQSSAPQTSDLAPVLPEVRSQEMTDEENATALLSGLIKETGNKEDADVQKPGVHEAGAHTGNRTAKGEKTGHDENSAFPPSIQAGEKNTNQSAAQAMLKDGNEGRHGAEQAVSAPAGAESATAIHQEQSSLQHQATLAAPAKGTNSADAQALPRLFGADSAGLLDHKVSIVRNGNRLAVQFEPDGLGKLDIDLRLDKGIVNAQIRVSDESTRSLIEGNMRQIMDALMKEGLSVGGLSVALKQHGSGDWANNGWNGEGQNTNEPSPAGEATGSFAARGLVNIFV